MNYSRLLTAAAVCVLGGFAGTARAVPLTATLDSDTVPATIPADDAQIVTVTIQNNGALPWTNPIRVTPGATSDFSFAAATIAPTVPAGDTRVVTLFIRAPLTLGPANLVLFLQRIGTSQTAELTIPVTIDNGAPQRSASYTHDIPGSLLPGERRDVTITVTNEGTVDWDSDYQLRLTMPDGAIRTYALPAVLAGASTNVSIRFVAPTTLGPYNVGFGMRLYRPAPLGGLFGADEVFPFTVAGAAPVHAADFLSIASTTPPVLVGGDRHTFNAVVRNTGTTTWGPNTQLRFVQRTDRDGIAIDCTVVAPESFCTTTPRFVTDRTDGGGSTVAPNGTVQMTFSNVTPPTEYGIFTWTVIVTDEVGNITQDTIGMTVGNIVTLTFAPGTDFQVSTSNVPLPPLTFEADDFAPGALVRDVNVSVEWNKHAGTCAAPLLGPSARYRDTNYRLNAPGGFSRRFVQEGGSGTPTYDGTVSQGFLVTAFDQEAAIEPPTPGVLPVAGTFRPRAIDGNLDAFDGRDPVGDWFLGATSNVSAVVCIRSYSITITANRPARAGGARR